MKLSLRHETVNDYSGIKLVNDLAFGQPVEGKLVDSLRTNPEYIDKLSIVAEKDGQIIGHILFFPIKIKSGDLEYETLSLAPMSVLPEFQGKGVGGRLILKGIEVANKFGFKSVIVLGHKEYYPRFGFKPANQWGVKPPFDVPDEVFMAIELVENSLKGKAGTVQYPKEFMEAE